MRLVAMIDDRRHIIEVDVNGHTRRVTLNGRELTIDWRLIGAEQTHLTGYALGNPQADHYSVLSGAHSYEAYVHSLADEERSAEGTAHTLEITIAGRPYVVTVQDARSQALESLAGGLRVSGDAAVRAPMPGLVVSVLAGAGTEVRRGQTIVVLEAMKMENDLAAPRAGIVKAIRVARGQTVNQNDVLAIVGDPGDTGGLLTADEAGNGEG